MSNNKGYSQQLEKDIEQLSQLIMHAKRESVQNALANLVSDMKTQLQSIHQQQKCVQSKTKVEQPTPIKIEKPQQSKSKAMVNYTSLTKYAFDQQGNKVKIYFSLDNVGNEVTADRIEVKFDKQAVTMKLHGYNKQNLLFSIPKLAGQIDPESCKYLMKTNTISLTLIKKNKKTWGQLKWKQDKFGEEKSKKQDDVGADPSAGIMNMMKKMYQQGDQNMKKTIAEAWTKANDKKGAPGMGGF